MKNAAHIPLDDFFSAHIPDERWEAFTVSERLGNVFDWKRVREQVIEPLLAGDPCEWHPFDFEAGLRSDCTYGVKVDPVRREPAAVILIEGGYSAGPALQDVVELTILVETPIDVRHGRLVAREEPDFLSKWH